ncbi:MAG: argininosuccinate lyase [Planctomycetes bacterium]|nr:argininosuccinate lyase [Planctomycetota bacterium]MCB9903648.1 argininosuccinate lyase [Planctomycetota bacterium]
MTKKLWGGRFEGGLDPFFEAFNRSLGFDCRLLAQDVAGSRAWAAALSKAGVLTKDERAQLDAGLKAVLAKVEAKPALLAKSSAEDVHSFVEDALRTEVGDLAKKLHTGRSRNDQVATDLRLWVRETGAELVAHVEALIAALVEKADAHFDAPIPGYTHLQRAQPITIGHHLLAYVEMFARDRERLLDALSRMDVSPLGCGALAGTAFPVDRDALAAHLGFESAAHNSLDAVSDRDFVCELLFVASLAMVHLSRLAEDWIFFASQEAGFIEFSDAVATGSSLMPQKKNPDAMELLRGKCGRVIGDLQTVLVTLKGLPLAYDKDLQEDKEALFDGLDTFGSCLRVAVTAVRHASFRLEHCENEASLGYLNATDLADLLVQQGVPFRDAHERAGSAVRAALEIGVELEELPQEILTTICGKLDVDLRTELSVRRVLSRRAALGGTAPSRVAAEVSRWKDRLDSWQH